MKNTEFLQTPQFTLIVPRETFLRFHKNLCADCGEDEAKYGLLCDSCAQWKYEGDDYETSDEDSINS